MSRIPPGLLYLTVYNPTLHPAEVTDDEDAEEQAHILFYTGRERAVSRDKILRQVGLAKALINFSNMFDGNSICENIHSQSRRMIMLSPEPNFWIHACLELARIPRPVVTKGKDKKGKGKDTSSKPDVIYDYQDGSLHDLALRRHILRGYELFKLTHGSFASILTALGQQALELQIERFFTVWAWKWDPEEDVNFVTHLGPSLHPQYRLLVPILDTFTSNLNIDITAFALLPPHLIPSTKLLSSKHIPASLSEHIMSRILPPPPPPADPPKETSPSPGEPSAKDSSEKVSTTTNTSPGVGERPQDASKPPNAFLNNMGGAMGNMVDVRKWNWPGYLTFGKSGSPSKTAGTHTPSTLSSALKPEPEETPSTSLSNVQESTSEGLLQVKHGEIDTESLHEAINSEHVHSPQPSQHQLSPSTHSPSVPATPARSVSPSPAAESKAPSKSSADADSTPGESVSDDDDDQAEGSDSESESDSHLSFAEEPEEPSPPEEPIPSFNVTSIHLSDGANIHATSRKRVLHLTKHPLTIAIIVEADHDPNDTSLAKACLETLQKLQDAISEEESKNLEASLPTVHKILERQDRFVISTEDYTTTSLQGFGSRSEHLFNGQAILRSDHDVQEVFSRGQNPQHWHVARRGLGTDREGKSTEGEVYMEIARKESTLTDVDNELAGVVRKFLE